MREQPPKRSSRIEPAAPTPGHWLWTCRAQFETHLVDELTAQGLAARVVGPALVETPRPPKSAPAFARVGFEVTHVLPPGSSSVGLDRFARGALLLQAWAVDTDEGNRLAQRATELQRGLHQAAVEAKVEWLTSPEVARSKGVVLSQLCLTPRWLIAGQVSAVDALSLSPGGRSRMKRVEGPSRAALKLEEALDWLGYEPEGSDLCVDLGAAPGGWTQRLVERGARVIAVDPAQLTPELQRHRKVTHVKASAFAFAPDEPVDWLFCDMAWRPLEVAELLGKWARRQWAQNLVANIKLPMNDKVKVLTRVRGTLEGAGWKALKVRQLYHDRDEVTLTARAL